MVKIMKKENLEKLFSDESFIGNVCLSYRHDFGLMNDEDKEKLKFQCKEWMRSIINNFNDEIPLKTQYSKNGLPFMYPHLEEDKIFNTNYDEIEKYAKEHQVVEYGDFGTPKNDNYPEFTFEYDGDIHPTSYDFTFKNAFFRYCWVEPFEKFECGNKTVTRYRTGSYYIIFDYEKAGFGDYKLKK